MTHDIDPVAVRRRLHRRPEPFWREFHTTSIIVEELRRTDVDEIHVGRDALAVDERLGVPEEATLESWRERAERAGADEDVLEATAGGATGVVARADRGDGPTVGLRVDIDGLAQTEATTGDHRPAAAEFRSEHDGLMHACGHDANAAIGVAALERVLDSDFGGTFVLFFQPASEIEGGGRPMARGPHASDLDCLFVVNVGFDHPTGEVVAGVDGMYAIERFRAEFLGESAHAAVDPQAGRNAVQAMTTAVSDLYAIPRHADGSTRVNVGTVEGGRATNLVADRVTIEGEVRGETTALREWMWKRAERVLESGARVHGCDVRRETIGQAPSADSDGSLADLVYGVLADVDAVTTPVRRAPFGTGEDAAWLMHAARNDGGTATHLIVGTDHPSGHHTPTFDVDEASLTIGSEVVARAVRAVDQRASDEQ
jgi:aminobenzoyl-glutamate utilization protein A